MQVFFDMHFTKKVKASKFSKLNSFFTHIWISDWGEKNAGVTMCNGRTCPTQWGKQYWKDMKDIKEEGSVERENMILDPTTW